MLIWAVDLDDVSGTSINALADALGKPRSSVLDIDGVNFALTSDLGDSASTQASKSRKKRTLPSRRYKGRG